MATVIYNGVGSGGDLFRGMKFCFLQRVPQRLRWIGIVEVDVFNSIPSSSNYVIVQRRRGCQTRKASGRRDRGPREKAQSCRFYLLEIY